MNQSTSGKESTSDSADQRRSRRTTHDQWQRSSSRENQPSVYSHKATTTSYGSGGNLGGNLLPQQGSRRSGSMHQKITSQVAKLPLAGTTPPKTLEPLLPPALVEHCALDRTKPVTVNPPAPFGKKVNESGTRVSNFIRVPVNASSRTEEEASASKLPCAKVVGLLSQNSHVQSKVGTTSLGNVGFSVSKFPTRSYKTGGPHATTFRGLAIPVEESRPIHVLLDNLEVNYCRARSLVYNKFNGEVVAPLLFLRSIFEKMELLVHFDVFTFRMDNGEYQFRTEAVAGGFCVFLLGMQCILHTIHCMPHKKNLSKASKITRQGVAHAPNRGFSQQLAAIHILERMRVHFPDLLAPTFCGLIPGCQYTLVHEKLEILCKKYQIGPISYWVEDLWGRKPRNVLLPRYNCACRAGTYEIIVHSDDDYLGRHLAAMKLYKHIAHSRPEPDVPLKDYFDIGAGCPPLKRIHPSVLHHNPVDLKKLWATQYGVSDTCEALRDPSNRSRHLYPKPKNSPFGKRRTENTDYFAQFEKLLKETLEWYADLRQKQILVERPSRKRREPGTLVTIGGTGKD